MGMFDQVPGLDGYQKQVALNQQQDAGQMSKLAQMLQVQEGGMKVQTMQDQLARQKRIRDELAGNTIASQGGASPALGTTSPGTPAGVPQPASIFGNQGGSGRALAARLNQIADVYERGGETETAIKYREQAQKMLPELKDEQVRMHPETGKPVIVRNYKDGTTEVSAFNPVDKIEYQPNGGQSLPKSGITGQMVPGIAPLQHTQSPDSIASIASAAAGRAQAERHFQNPKPIFNADAGGFVSPPTAANPQGSVTQIPGLPGKPLTESQGNATAFALRAGQALKDLDSLKTADGKGYQPSTTEAVVSKTPFGVGDMLISPKAQQFMNAEKNYIAAVLRKESGAAISQGEYDTYGPMFFPRPGNSKEVLDQKAEMRRLTEETLKIQAGPSYEQNAKKASAPVTPQPAPTSGLNSDVLAQAKAAIQNGADPVAVKARLTKMGIPTEGL